jgi:hypothetical protein
MSGIPTLQKDQCDETEKNQQKIHEEAGRRNLRLTGDHNKQGQS